MEKAKLLKPARNRITRNLEIQPAHHRLQEPAKLEMLQHLQLVKAVRVTLTPDRPLLNLQKKCWTSNKPSPPHIDDPISMFSRYGVLDVEGGGDLDAE